MSAPEEDNEKFVARARARARARTDNLAAGYAGWMGSVQKAREHGLHEEVRQAILDARAYLRSAGLPDSAIDAIPGLEHPDGNTIEETRR